VCVLDARDVDHLLKVHRVDRSPRTQVGEHPGHDADPAADVQDVAGGGLVSRQDAGQESPLDGPIQLVVLVVLPEHPSLAVLLRPSLPVLRRVVFPVMPHAPEQVERRPVTQLDRQGNVSLQPAHDRHLP
jgi:hypothetical protein